MCVCVCGVVCFFQTTVIPAHGGAVTSINVLSSDNILTSGADSGVFLWHYDGKQKGVLTRGREWDKLFRPRWKTPIDMAKRDRSRRRDAYLLVSDLGLGSILKNKAKETMLSSAALEKVAASLGHLLNNDPSAQAGNSVTNSRSAHNSVSSAEKNVAIEEDKDGSGNFTNRKQSHAQMMREKGSNPTLSIDGDIIEESEQSRG